MVAQLNPPFRTAPAAFGPGERTFPNQLNFERREAAHALLNRLVYDARDIGVEWEERILRGGTDVLPHYARAHSLLEYMRAVLFNLYKLPGHPCSQEDPGAKLVQDLLVLAQQHLQARTSDLVAPPKP